MKDATMTKPLSPANVTIALDAPSRVQDGSTRTHAAGGTVSITDGKTYSVYVTRHHVKQATAWETRGVHYGCELYLNGRKVREGALVEVRTLVEQAFRRAVNELSFQADKDLRAQDAALLADANSHYSAGQLEEVARTEAAAEGAAVQKRAIRDLRDQLAAYAYTLDTVDHGAAKFVNQARDDLFAAYLKLRAAEQRLQAQAEGKPIPANLLRDSELLRELGVN
jgi:hypothetical protein